jgi:hypothetical protein
MGQRRTPMRSAQSPVRETQVHLPMNLQNVLAAAAPLVHRDARRSASLPSDFSEPIESELKPRQRSPVLDCPRQCYAVCSVCSLVPAYFLRLLPTESAGFIFSRLLELAMDSGG